MTFVHNHYFEVIEIILRNSREIPLISSGNIRKQIVKFSAAISIRHGVVMYSGI